MMPSPRIPRREGPRGGRELLEELLEELLANLPAGVAYVTGPDMIVTFANNAYRQAIGGRNLLGLPIRQALPELAGQGRFETLDQVLATGQPHRAMASEVWVRRQGREPEQTFIDVVYQPVHDEAGDVEGILLYGNDVTAHVSDKRELQALAARLTGSEERYRTLFQTLPLGVIYYNADGSILEVNPAAAQIVGLEPAQMTTWPLTVTTKAVREDGSTYRREELPLITALRTGEVVSDAVLGITHQRTGERRWLRVTAVPDAFDDHGRPQRAYGIIADITKQRRADAALRESSRLASRLRETNVLGVVAATDEGIYEANDAFLDIVGYDRDDLAAGRLSYKTLTAPEFADRDRRAYEQLVANGSFPPYDKEYVRRDGRRVPVLVGAASTGRNPLRWVTFVIDLSARQRAERERAELLAREQTARAAAQVAHGQLEFLLHASTLVTATHDRDELLEQIPKLVVPSFAEYCVVFLPAVEGGLRAAATSHRNPAHAAVLARLREHTVPTAGPLLVQAAYTSGAAQRVLDVSAQIPAWARAAPEVMSVVGQIHPASALALPLLVGQQRLGVVVLGRDVERPPFSETDVAVGEELARSLATGLANVDTFAREHTIAETLQHAVLPADLPHITGVDLAIRYLPATDGVHVGGDWYDAFALDGNQIGLVIGDVAGHTIDSASIMGQVRSVLRAYAIDEPSPPDVLRRTNAALSRLLPEAVATVCYATLDVAEGKLTYASAGHPPLLCVSDRCGVEYLKQATGTMLGASADTSFTAASQRLEPGAALLFYTDGLIEDRHRDIDEGLRALASAMWRCHHWSATPEQMCSTALDALLGSAPRADDVCLLAARLPG